MDLPDGFEEQVLNGTMGSLAENAVKTSVDLLNFALTLCAFLALILGKQKDVKDMVNSQPVAASAGLLVVTWGLAGWILYMCSFLRYSDESSVLLSMLFSVQSLILGPFLIFTPLKRLKVQKPKPGITQALNLGVFKLSQLANTQQSGIWMSVLFAVACVPQVRVVWDMHKVLSQVFISPQYSIGPPAAYAVVVAMYMWAFYSRIFKLDLDSEYNVVQLFRTKGVFTRTVCGVVYEECLHEQAAPDHGGPVANEQSEHVRRVQSQDSPDEENGSNISISC